MPCVRIKRKERDFTQLDNGFLRNSKMRFCTRGFLAYLLSHPSDWIIKIAQIRRDQDIGRDALQAMFKELEQHGHACRMKQQDPETGQFQGESWNVYEDPNDNPKRRQTENPAPGAAGRLNKKVSTNTVSSSKDEEAGGEPRPILDRLNERSSDPENKFDYSTLKNRLPSAMAVAETLGSERKRGDRFSPRESAIRALKSGRLWMPPVYVESDKTPRLYCTGWSLQNLSSEVRDVLLEGFVKADLRAAQAAILKKLWGVDLNPRTLWEDLRRETGLSKNTLKTTVYGCAFGSTWTTRRDYVAETEGISKDAASRALRTPILERIFKARDKAMATAIRQKGVSDAFGKTIPVNNMQDARSALACVAQSYEVMIIVPAIERLLDADVPIVAWLHDGFYVEPHHTTELDCAIQAAVEVADNLGIETSLEIETVGADKTAAGLALT